MKRARKQMTLAGLAAALGGALTGTPAWGQSLFQRPINQAPANPAANPAANPPASQPANQPPGSEPAGAGGSGGGGQADGQPATAGPIPYAAGAGPATLDQLSLFAVVPPKPKSYQKHDRIEIIVNESSTQQANQTLETEKNLDLTARLTQFPSLKRLIESATLGDGIGTASPSVQFSGSDNFKGDGKSERKDRFTARVSALVVEVKPNGLLLIEARETQQYDDDSTTLVVSGLCDPKTITVQGTIQSTQLANLVIRVERTGEVKDGAKKGWIPQVLETIFGL